MRIFIDAHLVVPEITGIARYLIELITALINRDDEHEYIILRNQQLGDDHPFSKLSTQKLTWIECDLYGLSLKQQWQIPRLLKQYQPDVYHHPHFDLPYNIPVPSVVTIHDVKYIRNPQFFPGMSFAKQRYMRWMFKHSVSRANKIITVSESTSRDIQALFGTASEKISVVYHGYSKHERPTFPAIDLQETFGIDGPYILFVGERRPHKNIENLIKAFDLVRNQLQNNIKLVIIGKKYSNYVTPEEIIKSRVLADDVILTDFVSDDELSAFYQHAKMLVLPSYYEGFGLPVIEAMHYGVPVIVSNTTSLPEIAGDAALQVQPESVDDIADKIISLFTNHSQQQMLIERGKDNLKRFTWEQTAHKTLEIYQEISQR